MATVFVVARRLLDRNHGYVLVLVVVVIIVVLVVIVVADDDTNFTSPLIHPSPLIPLAPPPPTPIEPPLVRYSEELQEATGIAMLSSVLLMNIIFPQYTLFASLFARACDCICIVVVVVANIEFLSL